MTIVLSSRVLLLLHWERSAQPGEFQPTLNRRNSGNARSSRSERSPDDRIEKPIPSCPIACCRWIAASPPANVLRHRPPPENARRSPRPAPTTDPACSSRGVTSRTVRPCETTRSRRSRAPTVSSATVRGNFYLRQSPLKSKGFMTSPREVMPPLQPPHGHRSGVGRTATQACARDRRRLRTMCVGAIAPRTCSSVRRRARLGAARRQPTASRDRRQAGGMHGAGPANVCRATTRRRSRLPFRSTAWRSAPGLGYDLSSTGIGSRKINTSGGQ